MRIAAELRDHEAAGSLAEELPYWGWLEDGRTCLIRTGELIAAGRLEPAVVDGRSPEQIDRVLGRWQRLLSGLDADTRLYFYLLRRPSPPEAADDESSGIVAVSQRKRGAFLSGRVQRLEAYLVWSHDPRLRTVADGPASGSASRLMQWWKRRRGGAPTYLRSEIEAAAARFRSTVDAGRALVEEHTPIEMLSPAEASRFLSELINRPGTVWDGATGSGMNWRLALSELEAERGHLRLDGEPVILYSLLSPPGQARANLLQELYCLDAAMTVSLEWRPWAMEAARRRIRGAQRHYFARRYSMMAHVQETEGTAAAMVDSAAATESDRLGEALVELEADGVSYGEATLTVALHGELGSIERLDGDLRRLFAAHDAKVIREGYGQLPAWFSRLPAQPRGRQVRKVFVSAGVAACLAPLFGPPRGRASSKHLGRESLAVLETPWRTAYHYDLFAGDVGHTLMLGATGSGKSFTAELPPGRGAQVRPSRPDPGPRRLLPLAHALPRGPLPGAVARRGGADAPVAAVRAPGGHADVPVPDGLGAPAAEARRLGSERRGYERDPLAHRGPVCVRAGAADAERPGKLASVRDVAGLEPLDRRRRLGRLLR